jgi:uncharacterized membrane protein
MYILYHMDDGRNVALFGCFFVLLFGIYRLDARDFPLITLYTLAAYALVILLLIHLRPEAVRDARLELMSWVILACWLQLFNFIAAQISTLRKRVRESEFRFRSLAEMSSGLLLGKRSGAPPDPARVRQHGQRGSDVSARRTNWPAATGKCRISRRAQRTG